MKNIKINVRKADEVEIGQLDIEAMARYLNYMDENDLGDQVNIPEVRARIATLVEAWKDAQE